MSYQNHEPYGTNSQSSHTPNQHLAWHETLELHELTAFQSIVLMRCKLSLPKVSDPVLQNLYLESIQLLEKNLKELLPFFSYAPRHENAAAPHPDSGFWAGDLLGAAKTAVRNYAIAITETATPVLRNVLSKQLQGAIQWHASVYSYMNERSYYPSYNLGQLLENDITNAHRAIQMDY
ncbi:spore coat protein F [Shouchella clausii]|uniref:spore coat protein n=1 Tax=Shouchella tritolerans TaxID=2979466 RepID=UPI00078811A2|nr:spore coat protein [Shouchella tritolerans]GIN12908.1 spore coat protein F [Shouchella clausii]